MANWPSNKKDFIFMTTYVTIIHDHITQSCNVACHVTQWTHSLSIIWWHGGWRGRPRGKTSWRGRWNDMVKSNLAVKPVKVDGNARFEPFLKRCVLHLSHWVLVYVGWTFGNSRVLDLTLNPNFYLSILKHLKSTTCVSYFYT